MFCQKCGVKMPESTKFCGECGHEIVARSMVEEVKESNSTTGSVVVVEEDDKEPKYYMKSKLVASLCAIAAFPFLMDISMLIAWGFLIGGISGLLTHRVKDVGGRKFFSMFAEGPPLLALMFGVWYMDTIFSMVAFVILTTLFCAPFTFGSKQ